MSNNTISDIVATAAKRIHDKWMLTRIAQGWSYGSTYDNVMKRNPNIVSWDELPDAAKLLNIEIASTALGVIEDSTDSFDFALALIAMNNGESVRLPSWSPEVRISLYKPTESDPFTTPFYIVTSRFGCAPWKETYPEMMSTKWELYTGEEATEKKSRS